MFTEKDYGMPIAKELGETINKYVDQDDRAEVARITGVGTSTIRDVIRRLNSLTEANMPGIEAILKIAQYKCELQIAESVKDKKYFESLK